MNVAVLLSRQNLFPCKRTPWVEKTIQAISWIKQHNHSLVTSVGLSTWEILLTLGIKYSIKQILIIPAESMDIFRSKLDYYTNQFNLDDSISILPLIMRNASKNDLFAARDKKVIEISDILLPVSIRENGSFYEMIKSTEKLIYNSFSVPYKRNQYRTKEYTKDKLIESESFTSNKYLIHWTRRSKSNWPDENLLTYYLSIFDSDEYPRSGFDTLRHIIDKEVIIASNRHMPKGFRCVSFTNSTIDEFVSLMRWRKRYIEYSFEPYGIGIEREYGIFKGITKVTYVSDTQDINDIDRWKYQTVGCKADWRLENEYRFNGDFHLSIIPKSKLLCFCAYKEEADSITKDYGILTSHLL